MKTGLQLNTALNVFCDASVTKTGETYTSCPGYAVVNKGRIIKSDYKVVYNTTNNYGEIYAIRMGIKAVYDMGYKLGTVSRINLFSDSQISILGLREWIFKWYKNLNSDMQMMSIEKKVEISNQEVYNSIVNLIAYEGIPIHLYHQLGHKNYRNNTHLNKVINSFNLVNKIRLSIDEARFICYYNEFVDRFTRDNLHNVTRSNLFKQTDYQKYIIPVSIILNDDIMRRYADLIYCKQAFDQVNTSYNNNFYYRYKNA